MGSKHSRLSTRSPPDDKTHQEASRIHEKQQPKDEISAEARAEFTVEDIRSPENTRRAERLRSSHHDRFCKYRNYFKNHHMSLAREVGRKTSMSKMELRRWVEDVVGPLEGGDKLTKDDILEIAMVSAALTEYTEPVLAEMYDRGELDALPNVPLHTHNLRMPAKQQACRDSSDNTNKDKLEAAHYIGLEVMLRLNERLPVEHRMGEELREILNHPSNLRLVLATSNQVLHKKVDKMLISIKVPSSEMEGKPQRRISAREYDRLVQIVKHAQDEGFQDAMIAANGLYLYASLREQFYRLDIGDRPTLWNVEKDKRELRQPCRRRFRSPSPAPHRRKTPPSPEKKRDPEHRMVQDSSSATNPYTSPLLENKHRNPFSRLAARIFRSRSKKNAATTALGSQEIPHPVKTKIPINRPIAKGGKQKSFVKMNAQRQAGKKKTSNQRHRPDKGQRTAAMKAAKISFERANQFSASDDDDSDYVDVEPDQKRKVDRVLHVGARGGKYYVNAAGKKIYVK